MDQIKVGLFIAEQRKKQQLTQSELAKSLFVSDQAVSKWERGLNYPDIGLLSHLADLLKVSVSEILLGELSVSEIKTEEAVKEVLDYSSTLLKKEKKLFSKKMMFLRLTIALVIAAFGNFYLQVRYPRYVLTQFTESDKLWLNYQFREVQLLSAWAYCGSVDQTQLFKITQQGLFSEKSTIGVAIKYPIEQNASTEVSVLCPAIVEINLKNINTLNSIADDQGGKVMWTSRRQIKSSGGLPEFVSTIDGSSSSIEYTITNKSNSSSKLELYTRFSMTISGYTINGSTALSTIELNENMSLIDGVPQTYLNELEKGLISFVLQVEDSQNTKTRLDSNTNELYIATSVVSWFNPNFVETRMVEFENYRWIIKQVVQYENSTLTFRRPVDGMTASSIDFEGPSKEANFFLLESVLKNRLPQWPVPTVLMEMVEAQRNETLPWTLESEVITIMCIDPTNHYRIIWK